MSKSKTMNLRSIGADTRFCFGVFVTVSIIGFSLFIGYAIGPAPMPKIVEVLIINAVFVSVLMGILAGGSQQKWIRLYFVSNTIFCFGLIVVLILLVDNTQTMLSIEDRIFFSTLLFSCFVLAASDMLETHFICKKGPPEELKRIGVMLRIFGGTALITIGLCSLSYLTVGFYVFVGVMTVFGIISSTAFKIKKFIQPT